ncbi:unnamed protein product [Alopecurus aequalis]
MDIMDPFTSELLSAPPLPGAFSGCGGTHTTAEFDDDYLRAIGALPRRPSADFAPASVDHPEPSLPEVFAVEVSLPPAGHSVQRKRAAPVADVAASKNSAKRQRTCPWLPDYDLDIGFNLREKESNVQLRPSPDYLKKVQGDRMDEQARISLVDWMDEFARDYELRLLGAAALFTAAKYEEQYTRFKLNAADIAGYCGFATSKEVIDMEREMLATLRYELSGPTAYDFVEHFTSRGEKNMKIRRLAHQLADTSLSEYGCLQFMPSAVAATALFLAMLIHEAVNEYFDELTGYNPLDLIEGMRSLLRTNPSSRFVISSALSQYL